MSRFSGICLSLFIGLSFVAKDLEGAVKGPTSILLFPPIIVKEQVATSFADSFNLEFKKSLEKTGRFEVLSFDPESPSVRRAVQEGSMTLDELQDTPSLVLVRKILPALHIPLALLVHLQRCTFDKDKGLLSISVQTTLVVRLLDQQETFETTWDSSLASPSPPGKKRASSLTLFTELLASIVEDKGSKLSSMTPMDLSLQMAKHVEKARQYTDAGDVPKAILEYNQAIALKPTEAPLYLALGDLHLIRKDLDAAILAFRRATVLDRRNVEAITKLAETYFLRGRYADAITEGRQLTLLSPTSATPSLLLARAQTKLGNVAEAIDHYKHAQQLESNCWTAYVELGDLYQQSKQLHEAVLQYTKVVKMRPAEAPLHEKLAWALFEEKQYSAAFDEFSKSLELKSVTKQQLGIKPHQDAMFLFDWKLWELFGASRQLTDDFGKRLVTREQYLLKFQEVFQQVEKLVKLLDLLDPPSSLKESYLHRRLAADLVSQYCFSQLTFIETNDRLYEERALLFRDQAVDEYNAARNPETK